jgi:hypothetical protein
MVGSLQRQEQLIDRQGAIRANGEHGEVVLVVTPALDNAGHERQY